ncbi:MAG: hypothetical protein Q7S00_05600, partial [bacterium]|nr:hypothetical protein [bacterium]
MKKSAALMLGLVAMTFAGCGSSSSGTTSLTGVTGMEVASQMSLVEAGTVDATGSLPLPSLTFLSPLTFKNLPVSLTSAYYTDESNTWVHDNSMQALQNVNNILCMMDQAQYFDTALIGDDPYIALINANNCEMGGDQSSTQSNQSSGATQESLEEWVLKSVCTAKDANDVCTNQVVNAWIKQEANGEFQPAMEIQAEVTITEGKSDSNPFGNFHMDFKMLSVDANGASSASSTEIGSGYMDVGQSTTNLSEPLEITFFMN